MWGLQSCERSNWLVGDAPTQESAKPDLSNVQKVYRDQMPNPNIEGIMTELKTLIRYLRSLQNQHAVALDQRLHQVMEVLFNLRTSDPSETTLAMLERDARMIDALENMADNKVDLLFSYYEATTLEISRRREYEQENDYHSCYTCLWFQALED